MLVGVGFICVDVVLHDKTTDDPTVGHENLEGSSSMAEQEEPVRPLRIIGYILLAIGGIPFAIWKATYFFDVTGRHRY